MNTRLQVEHPDHRDGDRARSRALADSHRARRAARRRSGACARRRVGTRSNAASTPRIRTTAFCRRPGASSELRAPCGPGHPRRQRRRGGPRRADLLRPDDLEARCVGRGSTAGDRAHAARAVGIRRGRHQDDGAVLSVAAGAAGFRAAGFTRPTSTRCCGRATAGRSSSPRRAEEDVAAMAAALQATLVPASMSDRPAASNAPDAAAGPVQGAGRRAHVPRRCADMRYEVEVDGRVRRVEVHRSVARRPSFASVWTDRSGLSTLHASMATHCRCSRCPTPTLSPARARPTRRATAAAERVTT